jgi:4a-hydroxytetrahydrobiopterin dehydratase
MAGRTRLSDAELSEALSALPQWSVAAGKLTRVYEFADFITAWGFMSSAALVIQQMDHHPEWFNVYGRVRVELVTHDAGGITSRDVELAKKLEALAARR